jgi:hypothetical protein
MTWKPDICVYHGGCDDGFGAAWVVWKAFGESVAFVPGAYGKTIPFPDTLERRNILFVDFSLKYGDMIDLAMGNGAFAGLGMPRSIVVLDHHKTAGAELKQWDIGAVDESSYASLERHIAEALMKQACPIVAHFDMQSSGARMAWDFFNASERNDAPPDFIAYIEDRDLWRFAFGDRTRRFSAALRTYPQDFRTWDDLAGRPGDLIEEGEAILRGHAKNVASMCEHAYLETIGGHAVPVVNTPYHYASDAAHELLQRFPEAPFAAAWFRRGDGLVQFSLRSEDARADVSEIAKSYGGGGHRNAAGFARSAYPITEW